VDGAGEQLDYLAEVSGVALLSSAVALNVVARQGKC